MRNEALQWWSSLDEDSKIELSIKYYPGVGVLTDVYIENIYLTLYYPEGVE